MDQNFLVVYEHTEGMFFGHAPNIPGWLSTGKARDEARVNTKVAIEEDLKSKLEQGFQLPRPASSVVEFKKDPEIKYWVVEFMRVRVAESGITSRSAATNGKTKQQSALES